MKLIDNISQMSSYVLECKKKDEKISLIPTMGNLHSGHISLINKAREYDSKIVVSIFVNPSQFGEGEDYLKYPRTFKEDLKKLTNICDVVFAPSVSEVYTSKVFDLFVGESNLANTLCGKFRKNHFNGVLTIVSKLFNIVKPNYAFFGEKDFQQIILVRKLSNSLNHGCEIVPCALIREKNGLALSSRNNYLSTCEKELASSLYKTLIYIKEMFTSGVNDVFLLKHKGLEQLDSELKLQYLEILDSKTLINKKFAKRGDRVFICAYLKGVRLIDNMEL